MNRRYSILLVFILLGHVSEGLAQSLTIADVARQERERRRAVDQAATAPPVNAVESSDKQELLQEVLSVSGTREQLNFALLSAQETSAQLPESVLLQLKEATREAMDPQRLMPLMESIIADKLDVAALQGVLNWYRSPLGARFAHAELEAKQPGRRARLQEYAASLRLNPPSATRLQLIEQMDVKSRSTENNIKILLLFTKATYTSANAAGLKMPPTPANFEEMLRTRAASSVKQALLVSFLYTYRSFSEAELSKYLGFIETPPASAFGDAVYAALTAAFEEGGRQLGPKLKEIKAGESQ